MFCSILMPADISNSNIKVKKQLTMQIQGE